MVAELVEALGEGMQVAWRRRWMRGPCAYGVREVPLVTASGRQLSDWDDKDHPSLAVDGEEEDAGGV